MCDIKLQLIYILNVENEKIEREVVLSGKYNIKKIEKNIIKICKEKNYVKGLWGSNVTDCFAIVGENGAGKTQTINMIKEVFYYFKEENRQTSFLTIFEKEEDGKSEFIYLMTDEMKKYIRSSKEKNLIFVDENNKTINVSNMEKNSEKDRDDIQEKVKKYLVGIFNNNLNKSDYMNNLALDYDFSIGNLIWNSYRKTVENKYEGIKTFEVLNYFNDQYSDILDFTYRFIESDRNNTVPFNLPKKISISFRDDTFVKGYMKDENLLKKIENELEKMMCTGSTWINTAINRTFITFLKSLDTTVVPNRKNNEQVEKFYEILCKVNNEKNDKNVFEKCKCIFDSMESMICAGSYKKFITFLEGEMYFIESMKIDQDILVQVNFETKAFMKKLIASYNEIKILFPFLEFDFHVSSGEYNFLLLFSKLYKMKRNDEDKKENGRNILLLFDEADLTFHPRWQKNYIEWLISFINVLFDHDCVQIIITTHSPILLSDFPETNVLYLLNENEKEVFGKINESNEKNAYIARKYLNKKTFGNNIHTLFLDSFFLENYGSMGSFAEKRINEIVSFLLEGKEISLPSENIDKIIESIGDDILREHIINIRNKTHNSYRIKTQYDNEMLDLLKQQRDSLDVLIKKLEN